MSDGAALTEGTPMSDGTPAAGGRATPLRVALVVVGLAALAFGAEQLATGGSATSLRSSLPWLVAVLVVHDGVLAPLAVGVGWLLQRALRGRARVALVPVAVGLFVAVVLVALALPPLFSPGVAGNPTAIPRDYSGGLAVLLVLDVAVTGAVVAARVLRAGRRRPAVD